MADSTIANLTDGTTADATDRLPVERSPFGAGTNRYVTPTYLRTLFGITNFTITGPTIDRVYTFPDSAATILYSGGALGTPSSGTLTNATGLPDGGLTLTDVTTNNFSTTAHGFVPKGTNVGNFLKDDGTWAAPTASATLDGITAATADEAGIANADWNVRWNWAKTTNSEVGFEIGESAASTNGTSTSGVPNQVIAKFSTVAASTASPLSVYSRAAHVFSVSPTTPQILAAQGTVAAPSYSFAAGLGYGLTADVSGASIIIGVAGSAAVTFFGTRSQFGGTVEGGDGTVSLPTYMSKNQQDAGIYFPATKQLAISINSIQNLLYMQGVSQYSSGTADAVSYAMNFRKSRGTVASPTVITTGDDLLTLSGYGYVGATNTYQEAARITFDSTGTISDSATGIGGIIRFLTAVQGAEPAEAMTVQAAGDVTIGKASPATTATLGFPQIPTMAGTPTGVPTVTTGFNPMVYDTTNRKLWIYDYGGTPAWIGVVLA